MVDRADVRPRSEQIFVLSAIVGTKVASTWLGQGLARDPEFVKLWRVRSYLSSGLASRAMASRLPQ